MNRKVTAGREGLKGAFEVRRLAQVSHSVPVCVYDLAEKLGVEVKFVPGNSFEGMYSKLANTILVPTFRPSGRRAFACAHELGHWFFDHGSSLDELEFLTEEDTYEEMLANAFASYLLMPPTAVRQAFRQRHWTINTCTSSQVYTVAGQLGVGYTTLANHLCYSLRLISKHQVAPLLRETPKSVRKKLLGSQGDLRHLVIVDHAWTAVPIDLQVEDHALLPGDSYIEGRAIVRVNECGLGMLAEAVCPGIARVVSSDGNWASFVRVSRRNFIGRSIYRHLEDPDVN